MLMHRFFKWAVAFMLAIVVAGLGVVEGQTTISYFRRVIAVSLETTAGDLDLTNNYSGATADATAIEIRDSSLGGDNRRLLIGPIGTIDSFVRPLQTGAAMRFLRSDSGEVMRYTSAGDLGIGTTSPSFKVDIAGTVRATGASTFPGGFSTPLLAPDGTAAAPSFAFAGSPSTGMDLGPSNSIFFSIDGAVAVGFQRVINEGPQVQARDWAVGTGFAVGPGLLAGRNTSGSGTAGTLGLTERGGTTRYVWAESGLLRVGSGPPTENNATSHTGGTVIGDQSSRASEKVIYEQVSDFERSLSLFLQTPIYRFRYRDGRYRDIFTGVVLDHAPSDFGKDGGRVLNEISLHGHAIGAFKALKARHDALERRLAALEAKARP